MCMPCGLTPWAEKNDAAVGPQTDCMNGGLCPDAVAATLPRVCPVVSGCGLPPLKRMMLLSSSGSGLLCCASMLRLPDSHAYAPGQKGILWCGCAQAGLACCCLALEPPPLPLEGGAFFLSPPSFPPGIPEISICTPKST